MGDPRTYRLAPRSRSAASSGASTFRCTPVPISRPGELRQPRHHVDSPAEALGVARRGAHPHVERRQAPEHRAEARERLVQQPRPERAVVREARRGPPRHNLHVERHECAERAERDRLAVDRDDPLAPANLLLDDVLEQVASLGAEGVRGEALALARNRRRHERERIELRVRVRQGGTRLLSLVDDHVHVGGGGVGAHPLAPDRHRGLDLLWRDLRQRVHGIGRVDDHLVRAERRSRRKQVGLAAPHGQRIVARLGITGRERREQVRHHAHAPARRVRPGAVVANRVELGRRLVLVAVRERVALAVDRCPRSGVEPGAGPPAAVAGHDHAQARERIDAQLGHRSFSIATCSMPSSVNLAPRSA